MLNFTLEFCPAGTNEADKHKVVTSSVDAEGYINFKCTYCNKAFDRKRYLTRHKCRSRNLPSVHSISESESEEGEDKLLFEMPNLFNNRFLPLMERIKKI